MSWPSTVTVPSSGVSSPASSESSVDLPLPDGPTTATNSPRATERLASRSARTGVESRSKVRTTRLTSASGEWAELISPLKHRQWPTATGLSESDRAENPLQPMTHLTGVRF